MAPLTLKSLDERLKVLEDKIAEVAQKQEAPKPARRK